MDNLNKTIKNHLEMFSISTGINVTYVKLSDTNVMGCEFCTKYNIPCHCHDNLNKSAAVARSLFDGYNFFCEVGFTLFCVPIIVDSKLVGGYFSTPLLMDEIDSYLDEIIVKNPTLRRQEIKTYLQHMQFISAEKLRHLTNLLYAVSCELLNEETILAYEAKEKQKLQKQLNEQIQQMKITTKKVDDNASLLLESKLIDNIKKGNYDNSRKILNEILGDMFFYCGNNVELIKLKALELTLLISRANKHSNNNDELFAFSKNTIENILNTNNFYAICEWMNVALQQFFSIYEAKSPLNYTIELAKEYIVNNCENDITLNDVAGSVFLNPSYFSRVFKIETKTSFVEYLTQAKINKSKELLQNIKLDISEISARLGFADQSYFCKIFKRSTGLTPLAFRKNIH